MAASEHRRRATRRILSMKSRKFKYYYITYLDEIDSSTARLVKAILLRKNNFICSIEVLIFSRIDKNIS